MIAASNSNEKLSTDVPLLTLHHVTKRYGGVTALNDVSFAVQRGELVGVIGPNGAGKSIRRAFTARLRTLSCVERTGRESGWTAFGRSATDGSHRKSTYCRATPVTARRAFVGACPSDYRSIVCSFSAHSLLAHQYCADRAKRPSLAGCCQSCVCSGTRTCCVRWHTCRSTPAPGSSSGLFWSGAATYARTVSVSCTEFLVYLLVRRGTRCVQSVRQHELCSFALSWR
jgi:ABC transporter